jgi:uncharacterized protein YndB with AHSA1/START domain
MIPSFDPSRDLSISRIIKASPSAVWRAWTVPASFEQWWLPAPARCKVVDMDLRPGGSFVTLMSEDGGDFGPHFSGCFLALEENRRIVFTNALLGSWRPAEQPFMTGMITLADHPEGTDYTAYAMHKNDADRNMHAELGFYDGWGTVTEQLAKLAERGQ